MKKNALVEFKGYDTKALGQAVKKAKSEFADLVLDKNMNKLADLKSISKKKKDIAQISTILRQKQLMEELEAKMKTPIVEKGIK